MTLHELSKSGHKIANHKGYIIYSKPPRYDLWEVLELKGLGKFPTLEAAKAGVDAHILDTHGLGDQSVIERLK